MDKLMLKRDHKALTTKDLITWLNYEDPTGDLPVVIDGVPLWAVLAYPFYYDGTPVLKTDAQEYTCMNRGYKLAIVGYSWEDALSDDINTTFKGFNARYGDYESKAKSSLGQMQAARREVLALDSDETIMNRLSVSNKAKVKSRRERHPDETLQEAVISVLESQDN